MATEVARTIKSLSLEAQAALWVYAEVAGEQALNPSFGREARYSALIEPLVRVGGTWQDVKDLLALGEPALDWANHWHARQVWIIKGGSIDGIAA